MTIIMAYLHIYKRKFSPNWFLEYLLLCLMFDMTLFAILLKLTIMK